MTGFEIMQEIISILVGGITQVGEAIGSGISALVTSVMISGTGETAILSTFGVVTVVFAGIALALGLARLIVHWVSTLGGSRV